MNDDKPCVAERVGRALSRGNMRQRETACDLDTVGALGLVGIHDNLADAVYRLKYALDPKSYDDALSGVYGIARSLDARNHWRLRRDALRAMSKSVLDFWLNDGCRLCNNLGYEIAPGTPHLTDRPCQQCHGTKKTEMPWLVRLPSKPEGRSRIKAWYETCRAANESMSRHRILLVELEKTERALASKMRVVLAQAA